MNDKPYAEYMRLDNFLDKFHPRNPKQHDIGQIVSSIVRFGFVEQPTVDEKSGYIVAGHGRGEALARMMQQQMDIPERILLDSDGMWMLPVTRGIAFKDEAHVNAYLVASNRLTIMGGWDDSVLVEMLQKLAFEDEALLEVTGFDGDDLDDLLRELGRLDEPSPAPDAQLDRAQELQDKWQVQRGDLWQIGKHRLLCGNSTNETEVNLLFQQSDRPSNLLFDPPWDLQPALPRGEWQSILAFTDGGYMGDLINLCGAPTWIFIWDCVNTWYVDETRPLRRYKACLWYGDFKNFNLRNAHYGKHDHVNSRIIDNGRGAYEYTPDVKGIFLSDVFQQPISELHREGFHKHEKPIDWIRLLIGDCTSGDIYDPFGGSGTTIVAAEQLQRRCFAVEIEPHFCAAILERLELMGLPVERTHQIDKHPAS